MKIEVGKTLYSFNHGWGREPEVREWVVLAVLDYKSFVIRSRPLGQPIDCLVYEISPNYYHIMGIDEGLSEDKEEVEKAAAASLRSSLMSKLDFEMGKVAEHKHNADKLLERIEKLGEEK